MNNSKLIVGGVVIAIIISLFAYFRSPSVTGPSEFLGAAGTLLAENYIPYVMYNGGFYTAKSISTTADLTIGSSGTAISAIVTNSCTASSPVATYVASSTTVWICTDSAVAAGDKIFAQISNPTTPYATWGGTFTAITSIATTSGQFGVVVRNEWGAATSSVNSLYQKVNYLITR